MPMGSAGRPDNTQQLSLFEAPATAEPAHPLGKTPSDTGAATTAQAMALGAALATAPAPAPAPRFQHPRAQRVIALGGHWVGYEFRRARRRSIGFVVGVEGLSVSAPRWVAVAEVEQALQAKAAWILRKLQEQQERA